MRKASEKWPRVKGLIPPQKKKKKKGTYMFEMQRNNTEKKWTNSKLLNLNLIDIHALTTNVTFFFFNK